MLLLDEPFAALDKALRLDMQIELKRIQRNAGTTTILVRTLLRRGNFTSREHLQQRIESFIAYFNATMAKTFRWTMKGKPLVA